MLHWAALWSLGRKQTVLIITHALLLHPALSSLLPPIFSLSLKEVRARGGLHTDALLSALNWTWGFLMCHHSIARSVCSRLLSPNCPLCHIYLHLLCCTSAQSLVEGRTASVADLWALRKGHWLSIQHREQKGLLDANREFHHPPGERRERGWREKAKRKEAVGTSQRV